MVRDDEGASRRTKMKVQAAVAVEKADGRGFELVIRW